MKENYENPEQKNVDIESQIQNKFQELLGRDPEIEEMQFLKGLLKDYTMEEVEEKIIKSSEEYKKFQEGK